MKVRKNLGIGLLLFILNYKSRRRARAAFSGKPTPRRLHKTSEAAVCGRIGRSQVVTTQAAVSVFDETASPLDGNVFRLFNMPLRGTKVCYSSFYHLFTN